ncbi:MAG TPA: hypothetical protein VGV93_01490 [Acidimicrobiales bacterium]|nr:hypothetical protein [Acidimicrobiales bacterium]
MEDRHRAAVVVGTVVALVLSFAPFSGAPAAGQGVPLAPTTSVTEAPSPSTTSPPSSTTAAPPTTSAGPRSTTTAPKASASPSPTARKAPPSTSRAKKATTVRSEERPTTTDRARSVTDTSQPLRTTPPTLPVEQAATSSGLSSGNVVALIAAGLLAVAMALSLLTVRYVRATRPEDRHVD